jgi:hypothetical protein
MIVGGEWRLFSQEREKMEVDMAFDLEMVGNPDDTVNINGD